MVSRIATAEGQTKVLSDQLSTLTRRVLTTSQQLRKPRWRRPRPRRLRPRERRALLKRLRSAATSRRLTSVSRRWKTPSVTRRGVNKRTSSADDRTAHMAAAAEALRATVERGAPYQAELAAVKSFGAEESALAPLAPFAAEGIPKRPRLAREFTGLMPSLLQVSGTVSRDGSLLARLEAHAENLVRITPVDAPAGDDASAAVARINSEAARGDFAAVLADAARLPDHARAVGKAGSRKSRRARRQSRPAAASRLMRSPRSASRYRNDPRCLFSTRCRRVGPRRGLAG